MQNKRKVEQAYIIVMMLVASVVVIPIDMTFGRDYYSYGKIAACAICTVVFLGYSYRDIFGNNRVYASDILIGMLVIIAMLSAGMHWDRTSIWGVPYAPEGLLILGLNSSVLFLAKRRLQPKLLTPLFIDILLTIGCAVSLYAIGEFFMLWPKITDIFQMGSKYHGNMTTIGNRNFLGTYMTVLSAISIASILFYKMKRGYIYLSIITCGLLISQTRSAYVAFVVMMLISLYVVVRERKRRAAYMLLVVYLGLFIIGGIYLLTNIFQDPRIVTRLTLLWQDIWNPTSESAGSDRMLIWKNAMTFISDHLFLGYGPDHFGIAYEQKIGSFDYMYQKAHNEWLHMAITLGLPYLMVYLSLLIIAVKQVVLNSQNQAYKLLGLVLIGYTVQSMFNISVAGINTMYYLFLGMALYKDTKSVEG